MSADLYEFMVDELRTLLEPLHVTGAAPPAPGEVLQVADHAWQPLFEALGWNLDAIDGISFELLQQQSLGLTLSFDQLEQWISHPPDSWDALQNVFSVSDAILNATRALSDILANPPPGWEQIGPELLNLLLIRYLQGRWPSLTALMIATTIIEVPSRPPIASDYVFDPQNRIVRRPVLLPRFHFERIGQLLTKPLATLKEYFLGGDLLTKADATRACHLLFPRLETLFSVLGAETLYGMKPATYGLDYDPTTLELGAQMLYVRFTEPFTKQTFGMNLTLSSAEQGNLGLVLIPAGDSSFEHSFDDWHIQGSMSPGVKALAIGPEGSTLIADGGISSAKFAMRASYQGSSGQSALLLGDPAASHIEIGAPELGLDMQVNSDGSHNYVLALGSTASRFALHGFGQLSWDTWTVSAGASQSRLAIQNVQLQLDLLPDLKIAADLDLIFQNGNVQAGSVLRLREPEALELPLTGFSLDNTRLTIRWNHDSIGRLLAKLFGSVLDTGALQAADVALSISFGKPVREIRLDWMLAGRSFDLPGLTVELPSETRYSMIFHAKDGEQISHAALIATLNAGAQITAGTTFAWGRDSAEGQERELHNTEKPRSKPLIEATLQTKTAVSLLVADVPLSGGLPTFFQQLKQPLAYTPTETITKLETMALSGDAWGGKLRLNISDTDFRLPFLEGQNQFLELDTSKLSEVDLMFSPPRTIMDVGLIVRIEENLQLATTFQLVFRLDTFALEVDHNSGIALYVDQRYEADFCKLHWIFDAPKRAEPPFKGKRHLLTLVTKNYNYQIQQAPDSILRVQYQEISEEPISFAIRDFALGPDGLSMRATVEDLPVKLLGIDTKFRFTNSGFEMRNSKIIAFTLTGSGALPPALVGDSSVDIFLNFAQNAQGDLALQQGAAELRGNKLLQCKGTRFEFAITKLGLQFVHEGRFHLYFTLSGSAQFRLAPGDDREGLLMLLPTIKIDLVDCPLAGDVRVLAKHIKFLITLPRPLSFSLLGCFELELRGFGFLPQAPMFDGDGAMWLSGQIKFAQGEGDVRNSDVDYHSLYIGLPRPGEILPRIHLEQIAVDVKMGDAFRLYAMVKFVDNEREKGFVGEGSLAISGLPRLDAAFAFLRVRENESKPWVRAWFIYAQAGELSLVIPIVQIYIREIGFGLGYRYTLVMFKTLDEQREIRQLIKALDKVAASQGELARIDSWRVDLGGSGDPRWTVVLRAMISQNSASPPTSLARASEKDLSSLFLFDAVLAFRSDLTFLMSARGWLNTNYVDYVDNDKGIRTRPFMTAYIILSVPQQRFLARMSTNPGGAIGNHPPLPPFIKQAIAGIRFRATLLIEPGLFHLDLGWPNQLGWSATLGPFNISITGGFIFRISRDDLVMGVSYLARGSMEIEGGISIGIAGVNIYARADVAYGMRYIGVLSFSDPTGRSLFYGAMGLELQIKFAIEFWLNLLFKKIRKRFSFAIAFTAALEFGLDGLSPGVRGTGSLALRVCGRSFRVTIKVAVNEGAVQAALDRTAEYLKLGLDADDSGGPPEPVPGTQGGVLGVERMMLRAASDLEARAPRRRSALLSLEVSDEPVKLASPHYSVFLQPAQDQNAWSYFVIFPRATPSPAENVQDEAYRGFYPVPASNGADDFVLEALSSAGAQIEHFRPDSAQWQALPDQAAYSWHANWDSPLTLGLADNEVDLSSELTWRILMPEAFIGSDGSYRDPESLDVLATTHVEDQRVYNPSERDFEAAVRGAYTQFAGSPFFKHDPDLAYNQRLSQAFSPSTSIYATNGQLDTAHRATNGAASPEAAQHADQLRGLLVHDCISLMPAYARASSSEQQSAIEQHAPAFQLGAVFRFKGPAPNWLNTGDQPETAVTRPVIRQRHGEQPASAGAERQLWVFNPAATSFAAYAPSFSRVRHYSNASTIAIAWNLVWEVAPAGCVDEQADPEHHLAYYRVLRRALDSHERDLVTTVKNAQILNRSAENTLEVLKPRFQIVDQFTYETVAEQAALPETGRSYLYTITPIDYAGNSGRPLTMVATRYPDRAPRVPTDARLTVGYRYEGNLDQLPAELSQAPALLLPDAIQVSWTESSAGTDETRVPVREYRLLFRRTEALPVGSYGLDNTTQRSASSLIGSAVARPLPTDLSITLPPAAIVTRGEERHANMSLQALQNAGVFPASEPGSDQARWRPDAWDIFIQTIGLNGVPSSLAPVRISLAVTRAASEAQGLYEAMLAERQPAELEWLPRLSKAALLPPEDLAAKVGCAHFPMPAISWDNEQGYRASFESSFEHVVFAPHPDGLRCVRLRWNQAASTLPDYPQHMTAGFHLAELDIDAHTSDTFLDPERLSAALRLLQEIRMAPAADLPFSPRDTLAAKQWEAWYPSSMLRRTDLGTQSALMERPTADPAPQSLSGARIPQSGWYSWRESVLEWPAATIPGGQPWRTQPLHPFLQKLVDRLNGIIFRAGLTKHTITALNRNIVPTLPWAKYGIELSASARLQTISPGLEWRIDDEQNQTELFSYAGQSIYARRIRIRKVANQLEVAVASPFVVDMQQLATGTIDSIESLLAATPAKTDPYGWGVLQLFGLSTTFALRVQHSAQPLLGQELIDTVHMALAEILEQAGFSGFRQHVFIELLFQPSQSIELDIQPASPDQLLANIQVSLRPIIHQLRPYAEMTLRAPAGSLVERFFSLAGDQSCDIIIVEDPSMEIHHIDAEAKAFSLVIPASGRATLLIRGDQQGRIPDPGIVLTDQGLSIPASLKAFFRIETINDKRVLFMLPALAALDPQQRLARYQELGEKAPALTELGYPQPLAVTDQRVARFSAPTPELIKYFSDGSLSAASWKTFKAYADAIYTTAKTRVGVPSDQAAISKIINDYLIWSQRFFDAAGALTPSSLLPDHNPQTIAVLAQYGPGPWIATAYPRANTPAYATPDASGRLKYDHLVPDRWAHSYRYYLQPYGRYDRLYQALYQELNTHTDAYSPVEPQLRPDPQQGSLDVAIDRSEFLAAPLVLYSGRLDAAAQPGQPAAPGTTWEVIVAQHPEHILSERNQLVRRRLAYRQMAFSLLRRFADPDWIRDLEGMLNAESEGDDHFVFDLSAQEPAPIPSSYPALPDHLNLHALAQPDPQLDSNALEQQEAERRSLDLPLRIERFQQGALVLQWEGLPFYYAHRLLLIAQADTQLSKTTELTQQHFAYQAPYPAARVEGIVDELLVDGPFARNHAAQSWHMRHHLLRIPLQRFWDSLPAEAKRRWPNERPGMAPYGAQRGPGSLPDPEVVYQLTQRFSGNSEVQAEYYCTAASDKQPRSFTGRRLAERVLAFVEPRLLALHGMQGDYELQVDLLIYTETTLSRAYQGVEKLGPLAFRPLAEPPKPVPIPDPDQHTPAQPTTSSVLLVAGPLSKTQYTGLLEIIGEHKADRQAVTALFESWYAQEAIVAYRPLDPLPDPPDDAIARGLRELSGLIDSPEANELTLVWSGPIDASQAELLQRLSGDSDFQIATQRLAQAALRASRSLEIHVPALVPPELWPATAPAQLRAETEGGGLITNLIWTGTLSAAQAQELLQLSDDPVLDEALQALVEQLLQKQALLVVRETAPRGPEQLPLPSVAQGSPPPTLDANAPFGPLLLHFDPARKHYVALSNASYVFDEHRQRIEQQLSAGSLIRELREAIMSLLTSLEERDLLRQARVRPDQASLPDALRAQLIIDDVNQQLRWEDEPPTAEQQQAVSSMSADPAFVQAAQSLIKQVTTIDVRAHAAMPQNTTAPAIPVALAGRLTLSLSGNQTELCWTNGLPAQAEWAELQAAWATTPFATLLPDLLGLINTQRRIALPPLPMALEGMLQLDLPRVPQLNIKTSQGLTSFHWTGRVLTAEQLTILQIILQQRLNDDYRALRPAFQEIMTILQTPSVVELDMAMRPQQAELDPALQEQLLLGRTAIRFHGLMSADEGRALQWLYSTATTANAPIYAVERMAIERLYRASLLHSPRLSELYLRSRRLNALPSTTVPLTIAALDPETYVDQGGDHGEPS